MGVRSPKEQVTGPAWESPGKMTFNQPMPTAFQLIWIMEVQRNNRGIIFCGGQCTKYAPSHLVLTTLIWSWTLKDGKRISRHAASHVMPLFLWYYVHGFSRHVNDDNENLEWREALNLELRPHSGHVGGRWDKGSFAALGVAQWLGGKGQNPNWLSLQCQEYRKSIPFVAWRILKFNLACPRYTPCSA